MRRWGVAALAGATLVGGLSVLGAAPALGATTAGLDGSTVATITPVNYLVGSAAATINSYVITIPATSEPASGDKYQLTFNPAGGCTTTSDVTVTAELTASVVGDASLAFLTGSSAVSNATGCPTANVLTIPVTTAATTAVSTTVTISGITLVSSAGAASGAVTVSGSFVDASNTVGSVSFGSPMTIAAITNTSVTPTVVAAKSTDNAISNITITEPFADAMPIGYVCLALNGSNTWDSVTATPKVTGTGDTSFVADSSAVVYNSTPLTASQGIYLGFAITTASVTNAETITLSGLHADFETNGRAVATVYYKAGAGTGVTGATATCGVTAQAIGNTPTPFALETSTQTLNGTTADATAAAVFEKQFNTCTEGGHSVVLATDAVNVGGIDAIAASYLEGKLSTGLLLTQPTTLDPDTLLALRLMGVTNVYLVGGPLAISAPVISAIEATPAYNCGGTVLTGNDITVNSTMTSGITADDTAKLINASFTNSGNLAINGAYSSSGLGLYNDTTSTGSTSGPTTAGKTAFLIGDTDTLDAASIAGMAYKYGIPIIETPTGSATLGSDAAAELTSAGVNQVIAIGGQLALTPAVISAVELKGISVLVIAGLVASDTSAKIAAFEGATATGNVGVGWTASSIIVAQGATAFDALGAAAYSAANLWPVLLTDGPTVAISATTTALLATAGGPKGLDGAKDFTSAIQILGGTLAVPASQVTAILAALG